MFMFDIYGNTKPLNVFLVNLNDDILGCINEIIDESSASVNYIFTQQYELNFDTINTEDNNWYNYLQEGMYLLVDCLGLFKIEQPQITNNGMIEKKSITAYSVESELEDKTISFPINLGTKESLEYLVKYDSNETEELLNPYTGVPYDWIVLYNTFPEQLETLKDKVNNEYYGTFNVDNEVVVTDPIKISELKEIFNLIPRLKCKITYENNLDGSKDSILTEFVIVEYNVIDIETIDSYTLTDGFVSRVNELITFYTKYRNQLSVLSLVLENTNWNIGNIYGLNNNDYSLCNKKFQFEINETIYSFLTQTFSKISECIVTFNKFSREVNITPVEQYGEDTGVVIGYDTIVNQLNISTDENKVSTRLHVLGGDDLEISKVNFGKDYIDNLLFKINFTENNDSVYISKSLSIKYSLYLNYVEFMRNQYINLSKQYEENLTKISELIYRVPNDGLKNDWGTFSLDELKTSLTYYKNLLVTLSSLYKEDYGQLGLNNDGSINENFIKTTSYWLDYVAYKNIILEIQCALDVFPYYNDLNKWTSSQITQYKEQIKAWETEWTLYGINELEAKLSAYEQNMRIMLDQQDSKSAVIKSNDGSDWGIKSWTEICTDSNTQLTDSEKAMYGYSSSLYKYDTYMEYYNNMVSAKIYLISLKFELETLESEQETILSQLNNIKNQVEYNYYFTEEECKVINRLIKDYDYTNENILTTSIDTISDKYDRMIELLNDAKEQLSIFSRPQMKFSVDSENLLSLPEFKSMWEYFIPGNYIYVQYKNNDYLKLRLVGYTFNPCLPSSNDLQIEFSNFIISRSTYNDWASLLGQSSGGSSRSSSGSGGNSSGEGYGNLDDVDITISNTLLSKLLNSELFGTRVTDIILDTIDTNKLTARLASFGGLANGTTVVDGKCVKTGYIIDANYNGTNGNINNTEGSVINLESGNFNFAGGKLKYDNNNDILIVEGTIRANAGNIGAFTLENGALYTGNKISHNVNINGIRIDNEGISLSNGNLDSSIIIKKDSFNIGDTLTYNSVNGLYLSGYINATSGKIGGFDIGNNEKTNMYLLRVEFDDEDGIRQYALQGADPSGYYTVDRTKNFLYIRKADFWGGSDENTSWQYVFTVDYQGEIRCKAVYSENGVTTTSDRKLKNHIEYLKDEINLENFIYGLQPVMFSYKNDLDNKRHLGLYAQDLIQCLNQSIGDIEICQKVFLNEDSSEDNFIYGLNYSELIAPMITILQKQKKKIDELENRITILENNF